MNIVQLETGMLFYVDIQSTALVSFIYTFFDKNYVLKLLISNLAT